MERRTIVLILVLLAAFVKTPCVAAGGRGEVHPGLVLSVADVELLRAEIARGGWMQEYFEAMKSKLDYWRDNEMVFPEKGGEWTQNYVSPDTGRPLQFDFAEPHRHLDPTNGKYYTGDLLDGAWREMVHMNNINTAFQAGVVYQVSGEEWYAELAREILVRYAKSYKKYLPHGGPAGLGRIMSQSLGEAKWLIDACAAFDLVADSPVMSEKDREGIIDRLLMPAAKHVEGFPFGVHNIQVWESVSMLMAGLLAGREETVTLATETLEKQIDEGIRAEGMWYETSVGYHFFGMKPFEMLAVVCRNRGLDLCDRPALKNLFTAMPKLVMPDGQLPALNDGMRGDRVERSLRGAVVARYAFGDESLDGMIAALGEVQGLEKMDFNTFLYYRAPAEGQGGAPKWSFPTESENMPDTGLVILRRGGRYVLMKYNPPSGAHDHYDRLSIIFHNGEIELFPDRGTIYYSHPLYRAWYRTTEAHNTIMVDGMQQERSECEPAKLVQEESFDAVSVTCTGLYEGVSITRTLILTDGWLADVTTAKSDKEHKYDWFLHVNDPVGGEKTREDISTPNPEIEFTMAIDFHSGGHMKWSSGETTVFLAMGGGMFYSGSATGFFADERMPVLMWRQEGREAVFEIITEWGDSGNAMERSRQIEEALKKTQGD